MRENEKGKTPRGPPFTRDHTINWRDFIMKALEPTIANGKIRIHSAEATLVVGKPIVFDSLQDLNGEVNKRVGALFEKRIVFKPKKQLDPTKGDYTEA